MGGVLLAVLQYIEYKHLVRAYPTAVYGGLVALIFTAVGIYVGLRLTRAAAPARPVNDAAVKQLGITPREHEILLLIAQGLSNKEIGEKLFVSENTVKTHSYRLFDKLNVSRRIQAVQKARDLGLL
jgi:DNA-binding NarL/FixJ family response regulator